jgi:hypothetical protein
MHRIEEVSQIDQRRPSREKKLLIEWCHYSKFNENENCIRENIPQCQTTTHELCSVLFDQWAFVECFFHLSERKYIFIIGILNQLKLLLYYHKANDPHKGCKQEIKSDK